MYANRLRVDAGSAGSGLEDGYRLFHHHGSGAIVAFDNRFRSYRGKSDVAISVYDYRADVNDAMPVCDGTQGIDGNRTAISQYRGYPCWHQAGRDFQGNLSPMYAWNHAWVSGGGKVKLVTEGGRYLDEHLQANRDFFNAVTQQPQSSTTTPFDGSRGMGFGLLARRPTQCTPGPEAADAGLGGVGYVATDTQTLYRCSAIDTWVSSYRPYVYPHPLVGG